MEKRSIIFSIVLVGAIAVEAGFFGWPIYFSALYALCFLSPKYEGLSAVFVSGFVYDCLSTKIFGTSLLFLVILGISISFFKRLFGASFFGFLFGNLFFYTIFYFFKMVPQFSIIYFWKDYAPSLIISIGTAIIWRSIFLSIKGGRGRDRFRQLRLQEF